MNQILIATIFSMALLSTGCATLFDGSTENVKLVSSSDTSPNSTRCTLENEEGQWSGFSNAGVQIHKDGNPMKVKCENDTQEGESTVTPTFQGGYLALNLVMDLCIISCIVDGASNSFYDYPDQIVVPMQAKK